MLRNASNSEKILLLAVVVLWLHAFSALLFQALPRPVRLHSYTTGFSIGYFAWLGILVVTVLECMRRFRHAEMFLLLGSCAFVLSCTYVFTTPVSTIAGSFQSTAIDIYSHFHSAGFLVFQTLFVIRGLSILRRQEKSRMPPNPEELSQRQHVPPYS